MFTVEKQLVRFLLVALLIPGLIGGCGVDEEEVPSPANAKVLDKPVDPAAQNQLIGYATVDGRIIQLELEPAKAMWMLMDGQWMEHPVGAGERYHVEVKAIDPASGTRIPHASVRVQATNKTRAQVIRSEAEPMLGGSGLHYSFNHGLAGDGVYEVSVILEAPLFARSLSDSMKWMDRIQATFHLKFANGLLTEVTQPSGQAPPALSDPGPHPPATLPANPAQTGVFVGEQDVEGMRIQFELEPAKAMWMLMDGQWMEHPVGAGELYHVEVKPIDTRSWTRISHTQVTLDAINQTTGQRVTNDCHPMWGTSGLHYAFNHGLAGDGEYKVTITVAVPTFARSLSDREKWSAPLTAEFGFTLQGGQITRTTSGPGST